jgi:hypothetical protein
MRTMNNTVTDAINLHGLFFKRAVRRLLETTPGVRVLGEEYPVRYLEGSAIDLLIEVTGKRRHILPIECKRAYATTKQWIFFEDTEPKAKLFYYFEGKEFRVADAASLISAGVRTAVEGIQIHQKDNKYVADPNPIWDAGYQACKVTHGFLLQELKERGKPGAQVGANFSSFPVIVTTAPIRFCTNSSQSADLASGRHIGDAQFEDLGWVLLNFPFSPAQVGEHLAVQMPEYTDPQTRGMHGKEGVVIVNSERLRDFLEFIEALP